MATFTGVKHLKPNCLRLKKAQGMFGIHKYKCRFVSPRRKERKGILFVGWSPATTIPQDQRARKIQFPSFDLVHLTCPGHRSITLFL